MVCGVVAGLLLGLATSAWAQGPAGPTAAEREDERDARARALFAASRYQEAVDLYATLYAETLHPTYLRNVGRCYQAMGVPDRAIGAFKEYLRKAQALSTGEQREIDGYIAEMEALERQRNPPPPARPVPVPVPKPVAPASAPVLRLDQPARPEPAADSPHVYARWWFWTGVGVLVAGAVVTGLLVRRSPEEPTCDARSTCLGPPR